MIRKWKTTFVCLILLVVIVYFHHRFLTFSRPNRDETNLLPQQTPPIQIVEKFERIPCRINEQVLQNVGRKPVNLYVDCVMDKANHAIYLPFHYIKKTYDVRGELRKQIFHLEHSYSKVFPSLKRNKYRHNGPFLHFANYAVEVRSRVKCISAKYGVPISTQWDKRGYFYPTQIAQYALSHWSKVFNEGRSFDRVVYEAGITGKTADWIGDTTLVQSLKCIQFDTASSISLKVNDSRPVLTFDLHFADSDNVSIIVSLVEESRRFKIQYLPINDSIQYGRNNIATFGYGQGHSHDLKWKRFIRDLHNDFIKAFHGKRGVSSKRKIYLEGIEFRGVGCVTNLTMAIENDVGMFMNAVEWLMETQDEQGAWPIPVTFNSEKSKYPYADEIGPGWYSGMTQGHVLSTLSRAYVMTRERRFLEAAVRGLDVFDVSSSNGGVKAVFMDKYSWYEEYPTQPFNTFVLNGFIYALMGLYDLKSTLENLEIKGFENEVDRTTTLFSSGLTSLTEMLPFFDTGSGSVYDLRHYTMKTAPKLARWDYHSTHINLLYALSTVVNKEQAQILVSTADRWLEYMLGKHSGHN